MNKSVIVESENPVYQAALRRELEFWSYRRVMSNDERVSHPSFHPLIVSYLNRIMSGDDDYNWLDWLLDSARLSGCVASLGSGIGYYEERILKESKIDQIDLYELCPENNNRARDRLFRFGAKVEYHNQDLNFPNLKKNTYSLILSRFFLHHIINIEFLLEEINDSLTEDGIFVLYDYIGESRYRWSKNKVLFVNSVLNEITPSEIVTWKLGSHPGSELIAPDLPDLFSVIKKNSPFETIRSEDIPNLIDLYFGSSAIRDIRYGAVLHAAFRTLDFSKWDNPKLIQTLETMLELDEVVSRQKLFQPSGIFGVYGKAPKFSAKCEPWSESTIMRELEYIN